MLQRLLVQINNDKQKAVDEYLTELKKIICECEFQEEEFDTIDMELYDEYMTENEI